MTNMIPLPSSLNERKITHFSPQHYEISDAMMPVIQTPLGTEMSWGKNLKDYKHSPVTKRAITHYSPL